MMSRMHTRRLVELHAELTMKAARLRRSDERRAEEATVEAELLADQAEEAQEQAEALAAILELAGADVHVPPSNQLSLLSLGRP